MGQDKNYYRIDIYYAVQCATAAAAIIGIQIFVCRLLTLSDKFFFFTCFVSNAAVCGSWCRIKC